MRIRQSLSIRKPRQAHEDDPSEFAKLPDEKQSTGEIEPTEDTETDQQEEIEQQPATEVQTPDSADEKDDANELSAVSRKHSIHLSPLSVRRSAAISTHYLASSTDSSELNEEDTPDETPNPVETPQCRLKLLFPQKLPNRQKHLRRLRVPLPRIRQRRRRT